jgi:peptidoglycan/LPS O-acetylase OafA/YrhL
MKAKNNFTIVRSIACLLIVHNHMANLHIPLLSITSHCGFIMNTVFVIISGYLLAQSAKGREVNFAWLKNRVLRIYPPLIISIPIIYIASNLFGLSSQMPFRDTLIYYTGFQYFFGPSKLAPQLWYISLILLLYLLFKPTRYFLGKYPMYFFTVLLAASFVVSLLNYIPGAGWSLSFDGFKSDLYPRITRELPMRFIYHFAIFALSIYYAQNQEKINIARNIRPSYAFILLAASVGTYGISSTAAIGNNIVINIICILSAFSAAVFFCVFISSITFMLEKYIFLFAFISGISFEIYIIHYMFVDICEKYIPIWFSYIFVYGLTVLMATLIHQITNLPSRLLSLRARRQSLPQS